MSQDSEQLEHIKPAKLAKEMLGKALRQVGNIGDGAGVNTPEITEIITQTLNTLFELDWSDPADGSYASGSELAMDQLKRVLELLQASEMTDDAHVTATEIIAKTLAVLYPLSRVHESPSRMPPSPIAAVPSVAPAGSERRQAPRVAIEADIGFQSETNFYMGFTEDISTGGLFISTYDIRPIGATLSISFTLPNGHLVTVEGIVRWVREYNETTPDTHPGMGVQFGELESADKEAIHYFINQRPAMFYDE